MFFKLVFNETRKPQRDKLSLSNMVNDHGLKLEYYDQIKSRHNGQLAINEEGEAEKAARHAFFSSCVKTCKAMPTFVNIKNNTLFLLQINFTDQMATALRDYLIDTVTVQEKWISKLVIDDCGMKDKQFASILEGILAQQKHNSLTSVVYSNGEYGEKSHAVLMKMLANISELQIEKVTRGDSRQIYQELLSEILQNSIIIQKIKFTNINLHDDQIVQKICEIIKTKMTFIYLDLSWTKLSPKHMQMLVETLIEHPNKIKNLNLSYNSIALDTSHD